MNRLLMLVKNVNLKCCIVLLLFISACKTEQKKFPDLINLSEFEKLMTYNLASVTFRELQPFRINLSNQEGIHKTCLWY